MACLVPDGYWIERSRGHHGSLGIRLIAGEPPNRRRGKVENLPGALVPEKLSQPHRAVARLRDDSKCLRMPKLLRQRSLLLLEAIAVEIVHSRHGVVTRVSEPS